MFTINTILHPTDLSPLSEKAFHLACSLARDHGARLVVLHVAPTPQIGTGAMMVLPPDPDRYRAELEEKLRSEIPAAPGVRVEQRIEFGDAISGILQAAVETKSDLIVMGTHGRTGLRRLLMGSVAEQILRKARCPVVTVKSMDEDTKASREKEASKGDTFVFMDS